MSQSPIIPSFKRFPASAFAMALVTGLMLAPPVFSETPVPMAAEGMDHSKMAGMVAMPQTIAEHFAMADSYRAKAAVYREDSEMHRKMLAAHTNGRGNGKTPENPWHKKMRLHCTKYITDADKLAADADQFVAFHTMRAKEMQGQ